MAKVNHSYREKVKTHLLESIKVKQLTIEKCIDSILSAAQLIVDAFTSGGKVLICGNGGSAADCQHMATEFVNLLSKDLNRPGLPAISLTTDTSFLTAFSNDSNFEGVFERQVQALGKPNDLLIAISTSGNSKNVIKAVVAAKSKKMRTIALTGNGGQLKKITDVAISIPSTNTQYIQEVHLSIEHSLCELVEHDLFIEKGDRKKELWS